MSKLEKMAQQAQKMGYKTEVVDCPEWMKPYDKMLVVKMERSGFINQITVYNSVTEQFKIVK